MNEFKVGDMVFLITGGPMMTVSRIRNASRDDDAKIKCVWFVTNSEKSYWNGPFYGSFHPACLVKSNQQK